MLLHDYMEYFAREAPHHPCVEMGDTAYSYDEANQRCNQIAHACLGAGLKRGDRFAWLSSNSIDLMLIFYAASKIGVVPVPLNYRLAPAEWRYIINDCNARILVCEEEYQTGIDSIREDLEHVEHYFSAAERDETSDAWPDIEPWIASASTHNPAQKGDPSDDLYQMYTSGTTGLPKGAILSQSAIDANTRMIGAQFNMGLMQSRFLLVMPMFHAGASISHQVSVTNGATVIIHQNFDPIAAVEALQVKEITNCTMVPAMIQACLVHVPNIAEKQFPHLQTMAYGASPIAVETLREALSVFKCSFLQVFGMTETTACVTILSPTAHHRAMSGEENLLASCGRAALGTSIRIVGENDEEVERGVIGEITVQGPQIMTSYWNLPEATASTLKDGWLFTGDAAYMDDEGFVFIQDRIKDMIVSGGENIYSAEIEGALFEHPDIIDAAVIGIPSERWGEAVLAFVVTASGQPIQLDAIVDHCRERLAGFKLPKQVEFLAEIPRNPSGKVLKKDLREPYWQGVARRVG
jgi:acyl-CoA synthetase (AMP-forming)/AMP-acid ligase II